MPGTRPTSPRRSRTKAPASPKGELEQAAKAAPDPDAPLQHPAVVIVRVPNDDGSAHLEIATLNGLDNLAVPSILELAIQVHRQNIGLKNE